MKKSLYALLAATLLATPVSSPAGWLGDVIQGATESLGQRAVNEAADTAYEETKEGIKAGVKGRGTGAEAQQTTKPQKGTKASAAPAGDSVGSDEIYSKYDFVPGDKVIFYDDFSDTDVGEFPRKWTFTGPKGSWNNAVEVVDFKGRHFLRSVPSRDEMGQNGSTQYIRLNKKGDLPEKFTIEFDAVLGTPDSEEVIQYFVLMTKGDNFPVSAIADTGSIQITAEKGQSKNTETAIRMNDGKLHHIAISVNGTFVKAYVDNVRVVNDPDAIERPIERVGIYMGPYSGGRHENVMFGNFRLAEGGKNIKSALNTDGKIVTHGILFDTGSDTIKPESQPTLKMILSVLQEEPSLKFSIEGHTDDQGGKGVNQPLSEKRSQAVQKWLTQKGIAASRLRAKGWGDSKPLDSNKTVEGRANNRRVEFVKM